VQQAVIRQGFFGQEDFKKDQPGNYSGVSITPVISK
jgi:hypothetical protein